MKIYKSSLIVMALVIGLSCFEGCASKRIEPVPVPPAQKEYWPCGRDSSKEIDRVPVEVKLELLKEPPRKVGDEGIVTVTVIPNIDVNDLLLSISCAGGGSANPPRGFNDVRPIEPYIKGLKPSSHFQRRLVDLRTNKPQTFNIRFKLDVEGYGYIMGSVRAPAEGGPVRFAESSVLFFLASKTDVYFSYHSMSDLDVQKLKSDLTRKGLPDEMIQKQIKKLKRSGAEVRIKSTPGKSEAEDKNENDGESHNSVTINGTIEFTDISGGTHPVTYATVQIWDEEAGPVDDLVTTTTTDTNGDYSVTVDDNDGDGTGRDFYVVVRAEGDTVSVEDYGLNDNVATGDIWELESPTSTDVPDHSTLVIDITAGNNIANPQEVAFEAYEAVNLLSRYLSTLGEPLPAQVTVRYPRPGTDGSNYNSTNSWIRLAGTDVHDWDNIHHEYGHHIQNLYGTADNPGGSHNLDENLCTTHLKDGGTRMAWAEGWPTFFGTMAQTELGLAGIPTVGDTSYTDTRPDPADTIVYDLETFNAWSMGEGSEMSVQRVLWDLYDNVNDAGDTDVSLSAQDLWDIVVDNQPLTFSAFWNDLIALHTEEEKLGFGAICAQHNIAAEVILPADGTIFAGGANPTFQWIGNLECAIAGNERYSVRFYNDSVTSLIWSSPWQTNTSFTPSNDQRDLIFVGRDSTLRWTVANKDLTVPETGVYYGNSRTILDNFDVPDRTPVDIVLLLDISSSMGSSVPGSDASLAKLELLKQAVEVFVRTWAMHAIDGDRIGVVYFNSNVDVMASGASFFADMDVAANVDAVIGDVSAQIDGGCTAMGGALQVGYDNIGGGDNKKVMILFSDGMQSANPFICEEGTPAKLKVQVMASGASLPFDAFWCTTSTAKDPDGNTITPDGDFIHEHDIQIHTIGVGVNGAGFSDLIERISDETDALHHFTSAPDEDLDIFYTNDLINSLKTGTLEIVKTEKGTLSKSGVKTISIPVNKAAISLTLVLSWKGEIKKDALIIAVKSPNGYDVYPSKISKSGFYNICKFDFPLKLKNNILPHWGNWMVEIHSKTEAASVKYQFSAIVDEPCFHFDFDFPRYNYGTGDNIMLTATLTQLGQPLPKADGVWVNVTSPAEPIGNILSDCMPYIKPEDIKRYRSDKTREMYPRRFDAMLAALLADPKIAELIKAKSTAQIRLYDDGIKEHGDLKAGDGVYSNILTTTQIPGNYALEFNVMASSICGKVVRAETTSTLVSVNTFIADHSQIGAVQIDKDLYAVRVRPADKYGNLLGPGSERFVKVFAPNGKLEGPVVDQYDGSYIQRIRIRRGANPKITVQVRDRQLFCVPIMELVRKGKLTPMLKADCTCK